LAAIYPEYKEPYIKRNMKPPGYWRNKQHQKAFLDQLAAKLNIQTPDDWNNVPQALLLKEGGFFIKLYYNTLKQGKDL
jgi:hypothetical protein